MNYFVLKKKLLLLKMLIKAWSQQERKLMFTHIHYWSFCWCHFQIFLTNKLKFFSNWYFRGILINLVSLSLINAILWNNRYIYTGKGFKLVIGRGRPSFLPRGKIGVGVNLHHWQCYWYDKNCSELSQPEMSITQINSKFSSVSELHF